MLSILLALLALAEPSGRLCIGDDCSATTTATIAVKPAHQERRFFWISDDAKTAYAGVIPAKAKSIVLDPEEFSALDTTIDALDVTMTLQSSPEQRWQWKLDREEAKRLRRLYVPRGTYVLAAAAERHKTLYQQISASAEPSKLELRFAPLPLARGIVVDAEDTTIAGATVSLPNGTHCATANDQGVFACELPERVPRVLVVSGSGYVSREVALPPHAWRDGAELGRVPLSKGRLLTVKVLRPEEAPARVALFLDTERVEHSKLKSIAIAEREETVRFDVAEGQYAVVVEGDGPLERLEKRVTVTDADVEEEIHVEPFEVAGRVLFGEAPLQDGEIEIVAPYNSWRARLPLTAGEFRATMWQKGRAGAWVNSSEISAPQFFTSPELGSASSKWDIRIEKRMIVGRVFDAMTKALVPRAEMMVDVKRENGGSTFTHNIRPDGTYQILARELGTYTVTVTSSEHVTHTAEFRITTQDGVRTHDIALESGVVQPIDVLMVGGAPASNVVVYDDKEQRNFHSAPTVDPRGRWELRGMPGESRLVYFVASDGSFAAARVRLPRTSAEVRPLQVVIPPPCCSLRVRGVTKDGYVFSNNVLIRYNGEFVPPAITTRNMDDTEALLSRLPAGMYEIWVLTGEEDELLLRQSNGTSREPVRVGLSSGEQTVTVVANY